MNPTEEGVCPHCHATIRLRDMKRIPYSGRLKWYEFTPAPKTACPQCGGLVRHSGAQSRWLLLPFMAIIIILLSLAAGVRLSFLAQLVLMLVSLGGIYQAIRSGSLQPQE